jgi:formate dehydrogenase major subunit/formate dehydrogenase alpha subunit
MTNSMDDIAENAKAVFIIGSNTTEQHPVFGYKLRQAVLRRGLQIVVADPRKIDITDFAVLHLQHRPGTDIALANGLMHIIFNNGWHDQEFIDNRCEEFEDFSESLEKYTPEATEKATGVPQDKLQLAAKILAKNSPMAVLWAMGITQHVTGVMNVLSLANLQMLLGNMGVSGGGANPLRGQNNVQGACDVGALVNVFPGYQKVVDEDARLKFNEAWAFEGIEELYGDKPGTTLTNIVHGTLTGKTKAMYIIGENPVMSDPDSNHVKKCFEACDFVLLQEIFPSETSLYADILLPGSSFAEKDGTFTNTERRIQYLNKAIEPIGQSLPDWQITSKLANEIIEIDSLSPTGDFSKWDYENVDSIMQEISALTPIYSGVSHKRVKNGEKLNWPVKDDQHPGTEILHVDQFTRGKGKFHVTEQLDAKELPDNEYPFFLTTGRVIYHWHGGEMTRRVDGLVEMYSESELEISPVDAANLNLDNKQKIKVSSRRGEMIVNVCISDRVSPGTVFGTFHYPNEQNVNNLTISALDPVANIPQYKVCAVKIESV